MKNYIELSNTNLRLGEVNINYKNKLFAALTLAVFFLVFYLSGYYSQPAMSLFN